MSNSINPIQEGREAWEAGATLRDCPYPEGSEDAVDWEGGWMEAEEEHY